MTQESAPHFFDESDGQKLRIHTISTYLKQTFGKKMVKLSLDGGFTCPNRDGSKATGGCAFCSASGSGDMASGSGDILADLDRQIQLLSDKHTFRAIPTPTVRQASFVQSSCRHCSIRPFAGSLSQRAPTVCRQK